MAAPLVTERPTLGPRVERLFTFRVQSPSWALQIVLIFIASRVVTTVLILAFAAGQAANPWTGAHPSYFDYAKIWDAEWYEKIALGGYPSELPRTGDGHVTQNPWAFLPAFPALVRLLMILTGAGFGPVAVFVSLAFGLGTALLLYRLLVRVLPSGTAMFAVVLYCSAPLSPLLQVGYAESMFAFFLTLCLLLLAQRRYVVLLPVIAVMAFTRPGGLAFALALSIHIVHRYLTRSGDPFPVRERVEAIVAAVFSGLAGLAWLVIAAVITGVPDAYTATELAWRSLYIGYQELLPFTPWLLGANWWIPLPWGPILLVLAVVAFAAFLFSRGAKRLGVDLRAWIVSYVLYVLAVFFPQSSTFRILLPIFPVLGVVAQPSSKLYRVSVVLIFIALQAGWLYAAWWYDGYDWTSP